MKKTYDNFGLDETVLGPLLTPEISATLKRNPGFAYYVQRPFSQVLHFRIMRFGDRIDFTLPLVAVESTNLDLIATSLEVYAGKLAASQKRDV